MVGVGGRRGEIALFYAGESLLTQLCQWIARRGNLSLRLACSWRASVIGAVLDESTIGIIDATARPHEAMHALECAIERGVAHRVAVYTERVPAGLEIFVRLHGVLLLLGPMDPAEWDGFFAAKLGAGMAEAV